MDIEASEIFTGLQQGNLQLSSDPADMESSDIFEGLNEGSLQISPAPECSIHFKDERDIWMHCPFCNMPFENDEGLLGHIEAVHQHDLKEVCSILIGMFKRSPFTLIRPLF